MGRGKYLPDDKRSGFGLGWVYAERGRPLLSNPCELGTLRYDEFVAGWNEYFVLKRREHQQLMRPEKRKE